MIEAKELKRLLIDETVKQSGFVPRRGELHMSWLWMPVEKIIERVLTGEDPTEEMKVKFFQGNLGEEGIKNRLFAICRVDNSGMTFEHGRELKDFDGRLVGHTDCALLTEAEDILIECKTVPDDDALYGSTMQSRGVPFRVYAQVQGYMLWGNYGRTFVIYESRATGLLWLVDVPADAKFQDELADKALEVLADERVKRILSAKDAKER